MAPHRLAQHAPYLSTTATWLGELAGVGWLLAAATTISAALLTDPFTWALGLLTFAMILDYISGVATARGIPPGRPGAYSREVAARGRLVKIITWNLMIGCRMMEGMATYFGILNVAAVFRWLSWDNIAEAPAIAQGGIITVCVTALIALKELASVYGHRIENGGSRVLLLELVFGSVEALQRILLGRVTATMGRLGGEEAADALPSVLKGLRRMDDMGHAATHDGTPAPRRRHTDVALRELGEEPDDPADTTPPGDSR